jgi:WD40 repeat protein
VLLVAGLGLITTTSRAEPPRPAPEPRRDLYGDPLPPDALARLGSIRWRHRDDSNTSVYAVPSPDGRLVATRNFVQAGTAWVRVWELSDGRPVCAVPWESTFTDFGFTPDGSRLVLLLPGGVVRFHDPRTGKLLAESKPAGDKHRADWPQQLTADGRWVVTHGKGPGLTLTEVVADPDARRHEVQLEPHAAKLDFHRLRFAVDGHTLTGADELAGKRPLFARWDVRTGKLLGKTPIDMPAYSVCFALSPDGKRFAAWRYGVKPHDELLDWDTETGAKVVEFEGGDRKGYGTIRFSTDGKRVAADVARTDAGIVARVWELDGGRAVGEVRLPAWAYDFSLLPDGRTLLATSHQGMMFGTWDIATGRRLSPATGHESGLRHLAFTPDGKTLLTASVDPDERVTAWDAVTGRKSQELAAPHGSGPNGMGPSVPFVLTPAGALVTTGKGTLVWTDMKTGRELRRVTLKPIVTVKDPSDSFSQERLLLTHDPRTGRPAVLGLHAFGPVPYISPDSKHRWKDVVTLVDAESGEPLAHRTDVREHYDWEGAAVSPDGRWLARYSHDPAPDVAVELTPALGGRGSIQLVHPGELGPRYLFTSDGQTLVTMTRRPLPEPPAAGPVGPNTVRLWEIRTGRVRAEFALPFTLTLIGKARRFDPTTFAVSADGRFLAADRAEEKALSVWDLTTGAEVARRGGHGSLVCALAFRPDGKALASGHVDGTVLVWDLSGLPYVKPAVADRETAWTDLASADAGKAYRAVLAVAADPGGVAFLRDRVSPTPPVPAARLQSLVKDLDSDKYATREEATASLKKLGDGADAELRAILRGGLSAEQHRRLTAVLDSRELTESDPDRLRALRCVEILERIGTDGAGALLGELAKGAPGARLTHEAVAAVRRRRT